MPVNWAPRKPPAIPRDRLASSVLRRLNAQHITTSKLEAALRDVIAEYTRFELPFLWGSGQAAIADGTHIALVENNLLGAQHVRYGRFGGIAYHHISDTYIALFSHFIACGVWEAVYILDGLLKNRSALQPHTLLRRYPWASRTGLWLGRPVGHYADAAHAHLERCDLLPGGPRRPPTRISMPCLPKWSTGT